MSRDRFPVVFALLALSLLGIGCGGGTTTAPLTALPTLPSKAEVIAAVRAKLPPADRESVNAQEWCVVSTDERLGSMGPPIRLDIQGQPVFICCEGCKKKAESDPKATLARVEELKAKAMLKKEAKQ